ncbi:hypothetical protein BD310DRAFT_932472 [Dichomitus squalens]|uniref:Uncharacterized protein n=1 Tax=Dichomitus squalens TaxID=114155 RepID=A0A4Q9PNW6_9APHY|nr:hypothetical protein BD310DRAFT_932472 [Dichomitus squalens]
MVAVHHARSATCCRHLESLQSADAQGGRAAHSIHVFPYGSIRKYSLLSSCLRRISSYKALPLTLVTNRVHALSTSRPCPEVSVPCALSSVHKDLHTSSFPQSIALHGVCHLEGLPLEPPFKGYATDIHRPRSCCQPSTQGHPSLLPSPAFHALTST